MQAIVTMRISSSQHGTELTWHCMRYEHLHLSPEGELGCILFLLTSVTTPLIILISKNSVLGSSTLLGCTVPT